MPGTLSSVLHGRPDEHTDQCSNSINSFANVESIRHAIAVTNDIVPYDLANRIADELLADVVAHRLTEYLITDVLPDSITNHNDSYNPAH